eukprot:sb/3465161/
MPKVEKLKECGRFDFKDGFKYSGEVDGEEMMAHGHGRLIGPTGTYAGLWAQGMQTVGVYTWYVGAKYEGTWDKGKRHGYGVERRARWVYEGEWKDDTKTGYGVLRSHRGATFEGTWLEGTQDGYGVETYADGGFYIGQWYRGMRQGYGVRVVNPRISSREVLSIISNLAQSQHGLGAQDKKCVWAINNFPEHGTEPGHVPQITVSCDLEDEMFESEKPEKHRIQNNGTKNPPPMEIYRGEWKNDKRSGYGVLETCTGLKYEGEWLNNYRSGYGLLTHKLVGIDSLLNPIHTGNQIHLGSHTTRDLINLDQVRSVVSTWDLPLLRHGILRLVRLRYGISPSFSPLLDRVCDHMDKAVKHIMWGWVICDRTNKPLVDTSPPPSPSGTHGTTNTHNPSPITIFLFVYYPPSLNLN